MTCDDDDLRLGIALLGMPHDLDPVLAAGQDKIHDDHIKVLVVDEPDGLVCGRCGTHLHLVRFQNPRQNGPDAFFIVDQENLGDPGLIRLQ